jgi:cytochrome P450
MTTAQQSVQQSTEVEPPGPRGNLLFGNLRDFRRDPIESLAGLQQQYGDLASFRLGPRQIYIVSHPELAQEILVDRRNSYIKLQRPDGKPAGLQLILGNGLVSNTREDSWRVQRRMIQPMFHRRQILTLGEQITAAGERLLARWNETFTGGEPVNLSTEMMRVTLDVINRTMFGVDVMDHVDDIGPAVNRAAYFTFRYETNPLRPPLSWPLPANRRFLSDRRMLYGVIEGIIEERRKGDGRRGDLLDMLLDAQDEETGAAMSDEQLRDEVLTIFAAGHETTSHALTWTWYLLATHPEILSRMQLELDQVLAGKTPTVNDLGALPYTQAVFEEAMRLYPPVPALPRIVAHDAVLGGYRLLAGNRAIISIRNIHRHPAFWPEPDHFQPERFLPETEKPAHRLAYVPFGAGPRLCVGKHLALVEGALLLAQIGQRYSFRLAEDHRVVPDVAITMRPKFGMYVLPQKRVVEPRLTGSAQSAVGSPG